MSARLRPGTPRSQRPHQVLVDWSGASVRIEQGWSWRAFLFGPFWAFATRMPWVGVGMIATNLSVISLVTSTPLLGRAELWLVGLCGVLNCIYGAYGNTWRERNLLRRGFVIAGSTGVTASDRTESTTGLHRHVHRIWHDPVASNVIAAIVVAGLSLTAVAVMRTSDDEADLGDAIVSCGAVTLTGTVETHGQPTRVWFEWGTTHATANRTTYRILKRDMMFRQNLIGLDGGTRYYYRAGFLNQFGRTYGMVDSFATHNC